MSDTPNDFTDELYALLKSMAKNQPNPTQLGAVQSVDPKLLFPPPEPPDPYSNLQGPDRLKRAIDIIVKL